MVSRRKNRVSTDSSSAHRSRSISPIRSDAGSVDSSGEASDVEVRIMEMPSITNLRPPYGAVQQYFETYVHQMGLRRHFVDYCEVSRFILTWMLLFANIYRNSVWYTYSSLKNKHDCTQDVKDLGENHQSKLLNLHSNFSITHSAGRKASSIFSYVCWGTLAATLELTKCIYVGLLWYSTLYVESNCFY